MMGHGGHGQGRNKMEDDVTNHRQSHVNPLVLLVLPHVCLFGIWNKKSIALLVEMLESIIHTFQTLQLCWKNIFKFEV